MKAAKNFRNFWSSETDTENDFINGNIDIAYVWPDGYWKIKNRPKMKGVPVEYMWPQGGTPGLGLRPRALERHEGPGARDDRRRGSQHAGDRRLADRHLPVRRRAAERSPGADQGQGADQGVLARRPDRVRAAGLDRRARRWFERPIPNRTEYVKAARGGQGLGLDVSPRGGAPAGAPRPALAATRTDEEPRWPRPQKQATSPSRVRRAPARPPGRLGPVDARADRAGHGVSCSSSSSRRSTTSSCFSVGLRHFARTPALAGARRRAHGLLDEPLVASSGARASSSIARGLGGHKLDGVHMPIGVLGVIFLVLLAGAVLGTHVPRLRRPRRRRSLRAAARAVHDDPGRQQPAPRSPRSRRRRPTCGSSSSRSRWR